MISYIIITTEYRSKALKRIVGATNPASQRAAIAEKRYGERRPNLTSEPEGERDYIV